ncbi:MAG: hypothetical protein H0Z24_05755 [Thermosipho sp. (in: Bacteria)]|nr:hypothetical protein [Thermosipho sp. (in: thermotogales)]
MVRDTFLSKLVDSPIEEAKEMLEDLTFVDLVNTKKILELEYNRVTFMKDNIAEGLKQNVFADKDRVQEVLEDLYIILQRLEDLATIIETLKKEKDVYKN